jgi:hypothetical protein
VLTHAIRWLDAAVLVVLGVAVVVAIRGQYVVAHSAGHEWEWPGLVEELLLYALVATALVCFTTILVLWFVAALRRAERAWALAAAAAMAASVALSIVVYSQSSLVLRLTGEVMSHQWYFTTLLVFVPLLAGLVPATIYSFHAERGPIRRYEPGAHARSK